jgi:hypothetical protein
MQTRPQDGKRLAEPKPAFAARHTAIALLTFVLVGCTSTKEQVAKQNFDDDNTCASYGLKFGTTEYARCRQHIVDRREAEEQAYSAQVQNTFANMQRQNNMTQMMMFQQRPMLNCNTTYIGLTANTNCY